MSKVTEPTLKEMQAELIACGWKRKTQSFWSSPTGKLYLGPYGAWKVMKRVGTSPEFVERVVTQRP